MRFKILIISTLILLFTTSVNKPSEVNISNSKILNFENELEEIRLELEEADIRNRKLEIATSNKSTLKQLKKNIKNNK